LLESQQKFSAIFCASDLLAIGAIRALQKNNISIPDDKMVVGFDGISTAEHLTPSLTTIQQDTQRAGKVLVNSLLKLVNGEKISSKLIPTSLVERASTRRPS
ncbi:MAG: substrate-binding domain-containing protein, partial [Pseudomonadota bacterium]